jgi:hypothetical protein
MIYCLPTPQWMQWAKALGLPLLAVAVSIASYWSGRWQVRIAREKLRHDLYDRRFAVYIAFHELLLASIEKGDIETELRRANAARAHSPFLLDQLGPYLEGLHQEAFRINAENKLVRNPSLGWSPPEQAQKAYQLSSDKLALADRIPELVQKFDCLRLTDLSKRW